MKNRKLIVYVRLCAIMTILLSVFLCFSYADNVVLMTNQSYTFVMPDHDVSLFANSERNTSNWWWSSLKKDNCPNGDFSDSYYDWTCWKQDNLDKIWHWSADCDSEDIECLYAWAYSKQITTMSTIELADPDWYVKRWHMAKMIVSFMTNVLWEKIPSEIPFECQTLKAGNWWWESQEIHDYAIKSCTLWVMWINVYKNEFLPNDIVTRAEFGTILSRIIWWSKYNMSHTTEHPYYEKHLQMLKQEGIMTQIENPRTRKELRKRAWLMLKRLVEK